MLIEFRVANFRSFHDEQVLSLEASKDETHSQHIINRDGISLLKAAAIYGANASGKSNLIKAMHFMQWFVRHSATKLNQGDEISHATPFRLAQESRRKPSRFQATLLLDGNRYEYGFEVTRERVEGEWLIVHPSGGRKQRWLERRFDAATMKTHWAFRGPLKAETRMLSEKTRDNGLVLSHGANLNIASLTPLFLWFRKKLQVWDLSEQPFSLTARSVRRIESDPTFGPRLVKMLKHADLGIEEISVTVPEQAESSNDFEKRLEPLLRPKSASGKVGLLYLLDNITIKTKHRGLDSDRYEEFDMERDESNGTQRFFALAGLFLDAIENGSVLVLDELDCSMHPLLTHKLLEFFQSPEVNERGAQMIFATHDSNLMNPQLFRRDQIWLVEKNQTGASQLYALYDFDTKERPRNTEAFARNYLAGRYGAVPSFGPIFENLEMP
jgi:AAA15 family ATPase/GTPase